MTTGFYIAVMVLLGVALLGTIVMWMAARRRVAEGIERERQLEQQLHAETLREQQAALRLESEVSRRAQVETQVEALHNELKEVIAERAALKAQLEAQTQSEAARKEAEEAMRLQFKSLAGDILSEQSRTFRETSRESVEGLLKPFKQNIADFRERVEKIYTTEAEQHGALKAELKLLMELNRQITTETTNLTRALSGNSKAQGDFGEMVLDTILSSSNLVKGVHYQVQDTLKNEAGELVRPDVILNLPDKKQIIIDSKTSLTAYKDYVAAESAVEQTRHLKALVDSVRKHVAELSAKRYEELLALSPDFVVMFLPNEPAFLKAMQADPSIWEDAYKRKVIISSPTNLFALLKLVDNLWQRSDLERNTRDIAECGSKIYDQLVLFAETLQGVDKGLKAAQDSYEEAFKRFTRGNNNLVRLGERMAKLNVKVKKRLPAAVLDVAEVDEKGESEEVL